MLSDDFKKKYKMVPVALSIQDDTTIGTSLHNHSEFEVLLITKGNPVIGINGKEYASKVGDMFFINPMEIHDVKKYEDCSFSLKCICFDPSLIIDEKVAHNLKNEKLSICHFVPAENKICAKLEKYLLDIIKLIDEENPFYDMEISANISLMFALLLKNNMIEESFKKSKDTIFCSNVISYISEHYGDDISSGDVALELSYNQSYFCRNFKKNFGKSFSEYLNIYRLSVSRKFLEEEKMSITQIATKCGFNSNVYFSKSFKKHFGVSPSEYKKR